MGNNKNTFVQRILNTKKRAENGLQAIGGQIRDNVSQGQEDLNSGKGKYYASINPLRGAVNAYRRGCGG